MDAADPALEPAFPPQATATADAPPEDTLVAVVGAGVAGLATATQLGLLGLRALVIEGAPAPGGQWEMLYPDRTLHDIPAQPRIAGRALVAALAAQALPFRPIYRFGRAVAALDVFDQRVRLTLEDGLRLSTGAVVLATGQGRLGRRRLGFGLGARSDDDVDRAEAAGHLHHEVTADLPPPGQRVLVLGEAAPQRALAARLAGNGCRVTVFTDSGDAAAEGWVALAARVVGLTFRAEHGVVEVGFRSQGGPSPHGEVGVLDFDHVFALLGAECDRSFLDSLRPLYADGAVAASGVDASTWMPRVYAVGDACGYTGKRRDILAAFHEARLAAHAIRHLLLGPADAPPYTSEDDDLHRLLRS